MRLHKAADFISREDVRGLLKLCRGISHGNAPDVEVYLNPDPQNARYEIWIPVVER